MPDFTYCKGDPCTVHKLHRFAILVPADEGEPEETEANGYVIACGMDHAKEAATIEGGEGTQVVSQEEGADEDHLAYCPLCHEPTEDEDE